MCGVVLLHCQADNLLEGIFGSLLVRRGPDRGVCLPQQKTMFQMVPPAVCLDTFCIFLGDNQRCRQPLHEVDSRLHLYWSGLLLSPAICSVYFNPLGDAKLDSAYVWS